MHWPKFSPRRIILAALAVAVAFPVLVVTREARRDIVDFVRRAPPMQVQVRASEGARGVETSVLALRDEDGTVLGALRLPPGVGPFPALVILGGVRTGRRALDLVREDLPLAVATLDYAHDGDRKLDGPGLVARLPALVRDSRRTAVALRDLARFVARHPRVDASRVYLLGASLGAPFACVTAAADARAGLVLLYGFADHSVVFDHALRPHVRWQPVRTFLAHLGGALTRGFDARRTLPRACGTPVLVITSPEDTAVPRRSTEALWNAACEPRQRVELPGGHIDAARKSAILQESTAIVLAWIEQRRSTRL